MSHKNVIMLIDNRRENQEQNIESHHNQFKNSGFKATQIDVLERHDFNKNTKAQIDVLSHLQKRIKTLQQRVKGLQERSKSGKLNKRKRRRVSEIKRQYQCPFEDCEKLYGSQTSLKNHLKLKHGKKQKNI